MDFEPYNDMCYLSECDGFDSEQDNFTEWSILETARLCAEGEDICKCWYSLLSQMMRYWNATINMNLDEAILFCLNAANISPDSDDIQKAIDYAPHYTNIDSQRPCLWYKDNSPIRAMSIYRVTVALFETINYWCWHDSPLPITLNSSGLADCLQAPVHIEWEKYDGFLGYWKQQQAE